jgi:hypothetical protein
MRPQAVSPADLIRRLHAKGNRLAIYRVAWARLYDLGRGELARQGHVASYEAAGVAPW